MSTNICAHPQCQQLKPTQMYACKRHWFSLPPAIQIEVCRGYRRGGSLWLKAHKRAQAYWAKHPQPNNQPERRLPYADSED